MSSIAVLSACALLPWFVCASLKAYFSVDESAPFSTRERALSRYRRASLAASMMALPAAAVAGALVVDPALSTNWPTAGAWFFSSTCTMTAWVAIALARRTPEETEAMSVLETTGRAVQMSALPVLATGLALLGGFAVGLLIPGQGLLQAAMAALLSVAAVLIFSPRLIMTLGIWSSFPTRFEADGVAWRLGHLPAPTPFLTHVAALPWLRTALVSDGLFNGAPEQHWRTLVQYELGGALRPRQGRAWRWALALTSSVVLFVAGRLAASDDPLRLVAATALAVFFTGMASWFANRRPRSELRGALEAPSMEALAQSLRSLPPSLGQALPRTSHNPLGPLLYDRLFALGHDPGRRPHR
ncbi:MAG: hypothetical protein ACN4G0_17145 [Polyangiales bacterium]